MLMFCACLLHYQVLQVSRPLSGGVCAPDEQQHEMDTASMRKVAHNAPLT